MTVRGASFASFFCFILFFAVHCSPFLTSRKPFTNSFNLFLGLLFISTLICYSRFHSGSVQFISFVSG
jgi:hypothetical protein